MSDYHQNLDSDVEIEMPDSLAQFFLTRPGFEPTSREAMLAVLRNTWDERDDRHTSSDNEWVARLSSYLTKQADLRIEHVREWIESNLARFKSAHANMDILRRTFEREAVELKANVEICKMQCASCHLFCLQSRRHESDQPHDCGTSHKCPCMCAYGSEHLEENEKACGYPYVLSTSCCGAALTSCRAGHSGNHMYGFTFITRGVSHLSFIVASSTHIYAANLAHSTTRKDVSGSARRSV